MVLSARPGSLRLLRRARFWSLALLGLVAGHEAVYVAVYGSRVDQVLAGSGHGYWPAFALLAMVVGGVPLGATLIGLLRLRARLWQSARPAPRSRVERGHRDGPSYTGELVTLLPRLFLVVLAGFTLQENLEAWSIGAALPGLQVLNHLLTLEVLLAITVLVALAGAWLRWRESVLAARLVAARESAAHAAPAGHGLDLRRWTRIAAEVAHGWLLARRLAGRAPPEPLAA